MPSTALAAVIDATTAADDGASCRESHGALVGDVRGHENNGLQQAVKEGKATPAVPASTKPLGQAQQQQEDSRCGCSDEGQGSTRVLLGADAAATKANSEKHGMNDGPNVEDIQEPTTKRSRLRLRN
jgi:hypothetical protein